MKYKNIKKNQFTVLEMIYFYARYGIVTIVYSSTVL